MNILGTFADKNTDEALYEDAVIDVNAGDYNAALTKIGKMSSAFVTTNPVIELKAAAYAGLCGFTFLPFVTAMSNMGTARLFPFLLATFDAGVALNIDNCLSSENLIESIGSVARRSNDQNIFLALVSFAKMGNILSYYADVGHTGVATAAYDPCTVGAAPRPAAGGAISDADAREFGVSLALALSNLAAVAGSVNLGSASLTQLNNVCAALPAAYNFCGITDPAAFTANQVKGIRTFIKEDSAVGLGSNCTGDVSVCFCP